MKKLICIGSSNSSEADPQFYMEMPTDIIGETLLRDKDLMARIGVWLIRCMDYYVVTGTKESTNKLSISIAPIMASKSTFKKMLAGNWHPDLESAMWYAAAHGDLREMIEDVSSGSD